MATVIAGTSFDDRHELFFGDGGLELHGPAFLPGNRGGDEDMFFRYFPSGIIDFFMTGHDFTYNADLSPKSGVINSIVRSDPTTDHTQNYSLKNINLPAADFTAQLASTHVKSLFSGADTFTGSGEPDKLFGYGGNDQISGGAGNDLLAGGTGKDGLLGGSGRDIFFFETAMSASNVDHIRDFSHVDDTIRLENAIFKHLSAGTLSKSAFKDITREAEDADDRILYNHDTGKLYYDADGAGGHAKVLFAVLDGSPNNLNHLDFSIV